LADASIALRSGRDGGGQACSAAWDDRTVVHRSPTTGGWPPGRDGGRPQGQDNQTREEFERANLAAKLAAMPVLWLNPEDISGTVARRASDDSRLVTGMPISVDTGQALL
jgi:hypothetical protein